MRSYEITVCVPNIRLYFQHKPKLNYCYNYQMPFFFVVSHLVALLRERGFISEPSLIYVTCENLSDLKIAVSDSFQTNDI